ncbi:MAG: tetratricopeptide repeat protein [Kouleothrix sp.]|nr:tetratricopeptide repeat protein [Kouleothrix sp.]
MKIQHAHFMQQISSTDSRYIELGKRLLVQIRALGHEIADPAERQIYAQMAYDIGDRILEITGKYYPVRLELLDSPSDDVATSGKTVIADQVQLKAFPTTNVEYPLTIDTLDLLAALPLDTIPNVAPLPPGSRMPLSRNPLFVGREADLKALAAALKGDATATIGPVATVSGMGGIGKSNLATEFVHRYGQFFAGGVFWLSFAEPANVPTEIAACGGPEGMNLSDFESLTQENQVGRVRQAWQSPIPRLLVLDNCEDETLLTAWRPASGGCRVLVTSRRQSWSRSLGVTSQHLGVLQRAQSIALLWKYRPDLRDTDADAITATLGDLPLALHLAGSYLEVYAGDADFGDPAVFLHELQNTRLLTHPALRGEDVTPSPTNHILHVGKTIALSYERLQVDDQVDALAITLLARAACLAPNEPIPRGLLLATLELHKDDRDSARHATKALSRLVALGLLEVEEGGALRLHTLLVAFVQQTVVDIAAQTAVARAVRNIAARINKDDYPKVMRLVLVHLRYTVMTGFERNDTLTAALCNELGYMLQAQGDYGGARPYFERALQICEQVLGVTNPDTATSLNNLGYLIQAMGDYGGARPYYERALAISETVLGGEHPDTATSLNNLGYLLQAQGDYAAARPYYERALAINEQVLGPTHPATALSLNNLGSLLKTQGEYVAARPYFERALQIRRQALGSSHPTTAQSLNNLGALLQATGDYGGARRYFERALAIYETVLGTEHPNTRIVRENLSALEAPPQTPAQRIAAITTDFEAAVAAALADPIADQAALAEDLEARPHWGKLFTMPAARVQSLYAKLPEFQRLLRTYDPAGKFRNAFLDRYIYAIV